MRYGSVPMPTYSWADPAVLAFVVIPIALVSLLLTCVSAASRALGESDPVRRRAITTTGILAALWMGLTWVAAASGILRRWEATPPPFGLFVVGIVVVALMLARGHYGWRLAAGLPIWTLVAIQGFRLPLELAMHAMYERNVMPVQMSYSGRNFDILTGITALALAWALATGRAGRTLVLMWNVAGLLLLLNIVTVAILSTPRFRYFGDERLNVWVTYAPFVWLPAVMVVAALAGHLLIFRALRFARSG